MKYIILLVSVLFMSFPAYTYASNDANLNMPPKPRILKTPTAPSKVAKKKVMYFIWVGKTDNHREQEIINAMSAWRKLNTQWGFRIYSTHPFEHKKLKSVRDNLFDLDALGVIPEHQMHYVNTLKDRAQLDTDDFTPKDATIRTARQILADLYRFLMFKAAYDDRTHIFFSEVNNEPFKIKDSYLKDRNLYLIRRTIIAFFGKANVNASYDDIKAAYADIFFDNTIQTYLKNIRWYVNNLDLFSMAKQDLDLLFTGILELNNPYEPSFKFSNIGWERHELGEALENIFNSLANVSPKNNPYWLEFTDNVVHFEFSTTQIKNSLTVPDGRDSLMAIKNWIEYFEDPIRFDLPPHIDPKDVKVSRWMSRYGKVYVTARRYDLIDKAVAFVNKKIREGDVHFKRTFENTVYVDNVALKKRFKSIYEAYLNRLKALKVSDLDLEQTFKVAEFFRTVVIETPHYTAHDLMKKDKKTFQNLQATSAARLFRLGGREN